MRCGASAALPESGEACFCLRAILDTPVGLPYRSGRASTGVGTCLKMKTAMKARVHGKHAAGFWRLMRLIVAQRHERRLLWLAAASSRVACAVGARLLHPNGWSCPSQRVAMHRVAIIGGGFGGLYAARVTVSRWPSRSWIAATIICFSRCCTRWPPALFHRPILPLHCEVCSNGSRARRCSWPKSGASMWRAASGN